MMEAPTRRNWENVKRFTPELYLEYMTAPQWEIDSDEFTDAQHYHSYWCKFAQQMVVTSKATIGKWQQRGREAATAVERAVNPTTPVFDFQSALSEEPLPIAKSQIHEKVALLSSNPPKPIALPQQESQGNYVSAINQLIDMVFEDNNWPLICAQAHYDIRFWNAAILKWTVDPFQPGPFGQPGKITLEKISPDEVYFDPKAKMLDCRYMDYVVQKHVMEIGEIQSQYPMAGALVSAEADQIISDSSVTSMNNEDYIQSPQPKLARDSAGRRQKITVFELWVKDSRTHFVPIIKNANAKEYKDRFKIDDDGYIIGNWVKRYPGGRMLVVTGNVVLKDIANPFPHDQFPFVFPIGEPSLLPYAEGDAMAIMSVTRKINNMISAIHRYYQSEVTRPMQAEAGWSMDPNLSQQVPNDCSYILETAPGKALVRRQAMDIPPIVMEYISLLQNILDLTSGSSGVMRGQISDGAQLSAEALGALQNYASSRLALSATFFNAVIRQLGYQLMWILRGCIKEAIKVQITLPDGTTQEIDWMSDLSVFQSGDPVAIQKLRAKEDYLVSIKAGTGRPGAKDQQQAQSLQLFNDDAIDRQALLSDLQYPDRDAVVARMRQQELEDLSAKAAAKELGLQISEQIKQNRPGRRTKQK
jgi:hypothetical protein